jgi:phosphatidate phosphatase LPIN
VDSVSFNANWLYRYIHMTDLVDQMFPPIHRRWIQEYTDSNFWKPPIGDFALPDFTPPSPALSARSDTSNQSALARLRSGFSLGSGSRPANHQRAATELTRSSGNRGRGDDGKDRKRATFDSLRVESPPLSRRSVSPLGLGIEEEEEEERADWRGVNRGMGRARSADSMPGSLPGSEDDTMWEDDEEGEIEEDDRDYDLHAHDEEHDEGDEHEHEQELGDDAFDEDVLAAGEMASVPFL